MIIVSQDKDGIINFENITAIRLIVNLEDNKRNMITIDTVNAERYTVAKYVTEERAKEVLAEITEFWKNGAMSDYKGFICYEMPEE